MKRVSENWYMGTADAVYQNIYSIGSEQPKHVLILSGDHIYKMNYDLMLQQHKDSGADVTLATILVDPSETKHLAWWRSIATGRVVGFQEKPEETELRSPYNPSKVSASMGIYLFNTDVLIPVLLKDAEDPDSQHDFGHNMLARDGGRLQGLFLQLHRREPKEALYWRDVGTLEAYYEANMDLVSVSPVFNLYDEPGRFAPTCGSIRRPNSYSPIPAAPEGALDSLVSMGCIICGGIVRNSVLSPTCASIPMPKSTPASFFRTSNVGRHCRIRQAIIDRDVHIPEGTVIGYDTESDRQKFT